MKVDKQSSKKNIKADVKIKKTVTPKPKHESIDDDLANINIKQPLIQTTTTKNVE